MIDGRLEISWRQTAHLAAAIVNSQFGRKQFVPPEKLNPYLAGREAAVSLDDVLGIEIPGDPA